MPAASFTNSMSWAAYFAASLVLVSLCEPVLSGVKADSCGASEARTATGAVQVIDALEPGTVVRFSFHPPDSADTIHLRGSALSAAWCGKTSSFSTTRQLPSMDLQPEVGYLLALAGSQVEVLRLV